MYRFFSSENKPIILTLQEQFKPPKYKNIYYVAGSKDNMKYLDDIEDDFKNYIYLGVDPTSIIEKKEIKIYDTIWVGRVSTLIPTKIPKDLIDVFNTLSVPGKNIKFALYGTGGEKTIIELRTKKEKYPEMHLVIDTDKYVLDKYQNLDFFVYWLPEGCTESFGLVIVEAMLSKVPVIAQRAGAIPEIIQHGYNGYLFDDPSEINQYLNVLVQDERRKQVVLNAQRTANERFLAYNMAKKYKELYNERLKINEIKH
jgi:glycosyltransferase involved in cell wall biosynthesis